MASDLGLIMFCWGDDNNSPETIKYLKTLGVHGIIYDKMDKLSTKKVSDSNMLTNGVFNCVRNYTTYFESSVSSRYLYLSFYFVLNIFDFQHIHQFVVDFFTVQCGAATT